MSGAFRLNGGKFLVTGGGFAIDAACCCEFNCLNCSDTMQVVFSDVSVTNCLCYVVYYGLDAYSYQITTITGLNGTHTLTRVGTTCVWELTGVGNVITSESDGVNCDDVISTNSDSMQIVLEYSPVNEFEKWRLRVYSDSNQNNYRVFHDTNSDQSCPDGMVFTDTEQCSPGATATVTEL